MKNLAGLIGVVYIVGLWGCMGNKDTQKKKLPKDTIKRNIIGNPRPSALQAFLAQLIKKDKIELDTAWKLQLKADTDVYIVYDIPKDTLDSCFSFPFTDMQMKFCYVHNGSRFSVNNSFLPIDSGEQRTDLLITPADIRRFHYKGKSFIILWGHLRHSNGLGARVQFNYFFDITNKEPVEDVYTNFDGHYYNTFLYGDLNNDDQLDRIVYDGLTDAYCGDSCMITIYAQTYKENKWQALKDSKNQPYFIKINTDGYMEDFEVVAQNWMYKVE